MAKEGFILPSELSIEYRFEKLKQSDDCDNGKKYIAISISQTESLKGKGISSKFICYKKGNESIRAFGDNFISLKKECLAA